MYKVSFFFMVLCFFIFTSSTFYGLTGLDGKQTGSETWVSVNGPAGGYINQIAIDSKNPGILYAAGSKKGIYISVDKGANWKLLPFPESREGVDKIIIDPENSAYLYCTYQGFSKSTDNGNTWQEKIRGLDDELWITDFCVDAQKKQTLYLCAVKSGLKGVNVYQSTDGAGQWKKITGNLPGSPGLIIRAVAVSEGRVFVVINDQSLKIWKGGKVFYTDNGGQQWKELAYPANGARYVISLFVNPQKKMQLWLSEGPLYNEGLTQPLLYRSDDNGKTWTALTINTFFDSTQVRVIGAGTDGRIYIAGGSNLLCTADEGKNFTHLLRATSDFVGVDYRSIAVNPADPAELFLPLRATGIAYSDDGGKKWRLANNGIVETSINLLAVDPANPATVYCTSRRGDGTYRSDNYGATWSYLNKGGIPHPWADELYIEPQNNAHSWYIGDVPFICESTDKGKTWQTVVNPNEKNNFNFCSVYAFTQSADLNTIYALNNGFGIFKARKGKKPGEEWLWQYLNLSEIDYTYTLLCHPSNSEIIYSGYIPKPFQDWAMVRKSTDGGNNWETVLRVPSSKGITTLAMDQKNPDILYAGSIGSRGEVLKSANGGKSWASINPYLTFCTVWGQAQLTVNPSVPAEVYITTWLGGSWTSRDGGANWQLFKDAPVSGTTITLNETNPREIYIADRSGPTLWKSTDQGATWKKSADFSNDGAMLVMRVIARGPVVYAATFHPRLMGGKMYKSTNGGAGWKDITGSLPRGVLDIAIDSSNPDLLYVATNISGLYKSANGGASWQKIDSIPYTGIYDIETDPQEPAVLYAAARAGTLPAWFTEIAGIKGGIEFEGTAGVYRSQDRGVSWKKILDTKTSCRTIRIHPQDKNLLFAADITDGLLVSTDRGKTWKNAALPVNELVVTSCTVSGEKIYIGTQGCGVFGGNLQRNPAAGKCGIIWDTECANKPVPAVYSLQVLIDPTDSDRLFISAYPGGIFGTDKNGTVRDLNAINPSVVVEDPLRQGYYTLAVSPHDPQEMWVGTWGKGIFKSYNTMLLDIPMNGKDNTMLGKHITAIQVSPAERGTLYAAGEEGVFVTRDGGVNWKAENNGLPTLDVKSLQINSSGEIYVGTKGYGLFRWQGSAWEALRPFGNFGIKWPMWDNRPMYQYTSILVHPDNPQLVMVGTFPQGIYLSADSGKSWKESNLGWTQDGVFRLVNHPDEHNTIFAGTYNAINVSYDFGKHWKMLNTGWPGEQWVFSIDFDWKNPDVMYACSKNGANQGRGEEDFHGIVMKSYDGGNNWQEIMQGLSKGQEFYEIIVDKTDNRIIYLAAQGQGVMISHDSGKTWQDWNQGLTNKTPATNGNNVTRCFVMSGDGSMLYFGTDGSGVFRRRVK